MYLIIAEESEIRASHNGDGNIELGAPKAVEVAHDASVVHSTQRDKTEESPDTEEAREQRDVT